ncbi:DNA cytosine methyltransferase [Neorhizobium galegae]|uniref:DNA cytosine methyltransferase n=1 Tax=Neorhizobium galegae TaxID=399 RepID=UPI0021076CC2|nr:DNA cytosine methyltransferase [Neorhizobium galegae]MCQ1779433.1 DNA cytosine methyltransferase [Neorhizobium galegae]MCQ1795593.1 DNA cytosine methyltransferase [Neorhizobium galegae]
MPGSDQEKRSVEEKSFNILRKLHADSGALLKRAVEQVEAMDRAPGPQEAKDAILLDAGFTLTQTRTYRLAAARLTADELAVIGRRGIDYSVLKILVRMNKAARSAAMSQIRSQVGVSLEDIQRVQLQHRLMSMNFARRTLRIRNEILIRSKDDWGRKKIWELRIAARRLYDALILCRNIQAEKHVLLDRMRADVPAHKLAKAIRLRATSLDRYRADRALGRRVGTDIPRLARVVLNLFDEIFPDAFVAMEDWFVVGRTNVEARLLAQARHSLDYFASHQFKGNFPSEASQFHSWSALDSIAFAAGVMGSDNRPTWNDMPVRALTAVVMNASAGGEVLGLEDAGFEVDKVFAVDKNSATTLVSNREDWDVAVVDKDWNEVAAYLRENYQNSGKTLHLLTGILPHDAYSDRASADGDQRDRHSWALKLINSARPEAFCFEGSIGFNEERNQAFRTKLSLACKQLGYTMGKLTTIDGSDFGVPFERKRSLFWGVRADSYPEEVRLDFREQGKRQTLSNLSDILFPMRSAHSKTGRPKPPRYHNTAQDKYDALSVNWLKRFGALLGPDTAKLVGRTGADSWLNFGEKNFMNVISNEQLLPNEHLSASRAIPLNLPILLALHGLPANWVVSSDENSEDFSQQKTQIGLSIPPAVARAVGFAFYRELSGKIRDLRNVNRAPLGGDRGLVSVRRGFSKQNAFEDAETFRAREWREHILNNRREDEAEEHFMRHFHLQRGSGEERCWSSRRKSAP